MVPAGALAAGQPLCRVAPAKTTASALHQGPYSEMQMTSACLFDWVAEHDLPLTGQLGETYLVDECDTDDPEDFHTLVSLGITAIPATVSECGRSTTGHTHPSPLDLTLGAIYSLRNAPAGAVARGPASGGMGERSVAPAEYSSSGYDHTPVTRRRVLAWVGGVAAGTVAAVGAGQA